MDDEGTKVTRLRYLPETPTEAQRQHCLGSPLYRIGDCVLVWVNEGDLYKFNEAGETLGMDIRADSANATRPETE